MANVGDGLTCKSKVLMEPIYFIEMTPDCFVPNETLTELLKYMLKRGFDASNERESLEQ